MELLQYPVHPVLMHAYIASVRELDRSRPLFCPPKTPASFSQSSGYSYQNLRSHLHRTSAIPKAITAIPAPALFATAAPLKVACEKLLSLVALALSIAVALAVGVMMLDSMELIIVAMLLVVARAALCSERTEATPPAEVATGGIPVMIPAELVIVV